MSYSSISSILTLIPNLPQTTSAAGYTACSTVINRHIARADSIIDGYCGKRYSVPFATTPAIIGVIAEDITTYFSYRSFYKADNFNKMEDLQALKDDAFETLKMIRDGEINIPGVSEISTTSSTMVDGNNKDYQTFFDIDDCLNWKFNSDLVSDINDKR
jgi:phage gp36-like protein